MPRPKGYKDIRSLDTDTRKDGKRFRLRPSIVSIVEKKSSERGISGSDFLEWLVSEYGCKGDDEVNPDAEQVTEQQLAQWAYAKYAGDNTMPKTEHEAWPELINDFFPHWPESTVDCLLDLWNEKYNERMFARAEVLHPFVDTSWLTDEQRQQIALMMASSGKTEQECIDLLGYEIPFERMSPAEIADALWEKLHNVVGSPVEHTYWNDALESFGVYSDEAYEILEEKKKVKLAEFEARPKMILSNYNLSELVNFVSDIYRLPKPIVINKFKSALALVRKYLKGQSTKPSLVEIAREMVWLGYKEHLFWHRLDKGGVEIMLGAGHKTKLTLTSLGNTYIAAVEAERKKLVEIELAKPYTGPVPDFAF